MVPSFNALIFDLDGTLVDSSEIIRGIMTSWCRRHAIPFESVLKACHGERTEDTVSRVAPHLCAKTEAAEIEHLESTALEGLIPLSGAGRFLDLLAPFSWAIATSSSMLIAKPKLKACGMPIPAVFITAESVQYGKPHPEPFLKAASGLGVAPEKCLVFEDADNGVTSALRAGCGVVLVGEGCRIEHPRIIARFNSFVDATLTSEGCLQMRGKPVATLAKKSD